MFTTLTVPDQTMPNLNEPAHAEEFGTLQRFVDALGRHGNVQEGLFAEADLIQLCMDGELLNCNANNINPYCTIALPPAPGQPADVLDYVELPDPGGEDKDSNTPSTKCHAAFHLQASEAVVIVGRTPPPMKYFSYTLMVGTSRLEPPPSSMNDADLEGQQVRNVPGRLVTPTRQQVLFGGLGDPLNNLKIHTEESPEGGPTPFLQHFMIIVASDNAVYEQVRQAALAAGYPDGCINQLVVPSEVVRLGIDGDSDTITFAHRLALPEDPKVLNEYLQNPPVKVFRVTLDLEPTQPLAIPYLTPRGTGRTELGLWKPVQRLRRAILDNYREHYDAIELTSDVWLQESNIAIQQGLDNLGEGRDTVYLGTESFLLPEDALVVAYGVNHAKTGKATYANVVVYGSELLNGVTSVQSDRYEDSARRFLDEAVAKDLYAWGFGFAPRPGDRYYTQIPSTLPPFRNARRLVAGQRVFLAFRAYAEPTTKVGPAWQELILDRAIVFLPRKR